MILMDQQPTSPNSSNVLDPQKIVASFELKNGDYVADFGSGHGYFILALARSVAPNGKVFAIDIQRSMLDVVRAKVRLENIHNIDFILSDLENPQGSKLKNDFVDLVLITNVLHQSEHKDAIIKEAARILHPEGRIALIEWESSSTGFGPPTDMRISKDAAINLCKAQSLSFEKEFPAGNYHYGLIFKK